MSLTGKATTDQELRGKINGLEVLKGYSAYEIALIYGFKGTEEEWLETLKGENGEKGANGEKGRDGASAYEVAKANGFVGTEEEWLASLKAVDAEIEKQIDKNTEDIAYLQSYLGYTDDDIVGVAVDLENNTFTRLAGAIGLEAGKDFNKFSMYGQRVRCTVDDDGTINSIYGQDAGNEWERVITCESASFTKMGSPEDDDSVGGVCQDFDSYSEYVSYVPHVSEYGTDIKITVTNKTAGGTVTEFNSTMGVPGETQTFGEFVSSDGKTITLTGFPLGDSDVSEPTSYTGGFIFFVHPYTTDDIDITVDIKSGEVFIDDGSHGQVMVYQPKFYYRVVPTKLEKQEGEGYHILKANYYITAKPKPLFKLHPAFYDASGKEVDYILFSAYEGSVENGALCSVSGAKPACSYIRSEFENLAKSRGEGWHIDTFKSVSANQLLMLIEFASFNMQNEVGEGVCLLGASSTNRASLTGSTASLGNASGRAEQTTNEYNGVETVYTEDGKTAISYRGMENVWGNIYKFVAGITAIIKETGKTMSVCDNFNFIDGTNSYYHEVGFSTTNVNSYIKCFGYGTETYDWAFLPSYLGELHSTSEYPVGDYAIIDSNVVTSGSRNFFYGGQWSAEKQAGAFCYHTANSVAGKYTFVGARLMYVKGV